MCHFEEQWVNNTVACPSIGFRYVDDTFSLFDNKDKSSRFLHYLNNRHPNIKFTMPELEENQEIPFLDVLIKRHQNTFSTTVHRKKTFTSLYTKWDAFTPLHNRFNPHPTYRCFLICSTFSSLQAALSDLKKTLLLNGYPKGHNFLQYE